MPTVSQILASAKRDQDLIAALRRRYSHTTNSTTRRHLLRRIRKLEDHLDALYREFLRKGVPGAFTVFGSRKPRVIKGILVQVDFSLDGLYFSNPAPKIGNGKLVWVRTRVEAANKAAEGEIASVPWLAHFQWIKPRYWTSNDTIPADGRNEYFVSLPLTITRQYKSPSSGTTKGNFGTFVDVYKAIDLTTTPPTTGAEPTIVYASWAAGTYFHYTVNTTTKIASSRSTTTTGGFTAQVETSSTKYYYTPQAKYITLRKLLTGSRAGYFMNVERDGVTLKELFESDQ